MRSKRILFLTVPILTGLLLLVLVAAFVANSPTAHAAPAQNVRMLAPAQAPEQDSHTAPAVQSSRRISIPYGFAPTLPLRSGGQEVLVRGHGSCTAGETFTIAVTVTHNASGAMALGNVTGPCAGEESLQRWHLTAEAEDDSLSLGAAEVCGFVQTLDGGYATDEQDWCVDVRLGDYIFLPRVLK